MATISMKFINRLSAKTHGAPAEFNIQRGNNEVHKLSVAPGGGTTTLPTEGKDGPWKVYAAVAGQTTNSILVDDRRAVVTLSLVSGALVLVAGSAPPEEDADEPCKPEEGDSGGHGHGPGRRGGAVSSSERASEEEILDYWTVARKNSATPKMKRADIPPELLEKIRERKARDARIPSAGAPVTSLVPSASLGVAPYAAVGKLFFRWKGDPYVGTAWVIKTPTLGIFTAGHNLFEDGKWSDMVLFDMQYDDGHSSLEVAGKQLYVADAWHEGEDHAYDLAVVGPSSALAESTPALAYLMDIDTPASYRAVGYPARPITGYNFDGKHMWQSVGDSIATGQGCVSAYNNMTQGSSGGPWCVQVENKWYANGVQSHRLQDPDVALSPVFTAAKINPLLRAAGLIPRGEDHPARHRHHDQAVLQPG
ncbi:MAG: hypothetical protein HOW73_17305 [Polyangiaceae bacterium]|nr:hypothetical protein [Polyangiaceae bacterium]